jgi:iron complex outermembrane receptor protein
VQVIRREEIQRSGATTAEELLARISANFGGHTEDLGLGDADTPGFSGASLRGLGAAETLILLNGRRLANYAFTSTTGPGVDLHAIPLAAIERVEVLKDGASALYGSDAIGGVINFVTRQDYAGTELGVSYRATEAGGGARARATLSAGHGDIAVDGFNVFGVVDCSGSIIRCGRPTARCLTPSGRSSASTPRSVLRGRRTSAFRAGWSIRRPRPAPRSPSKRTAPADSTTPRRSP